MPSGNMAFVAHNQDWLKIPKLNIYEVYFFMFFYEVYFGTDPSLPKLHFYDVYVYDIN